ncbi:hypothetical protein CEXT_582571 [Caerostris extrusa]|uniref:Uncharacterized protein n=1 Tax=Caerostris extrusa TaxID=172846 RepID=A0AAV4YCU5_CAEEX|nr:hypothetical protein CEXT_582571 [Caerostris extrusa]
MNWRQIRNEPTISSESVGDYYSYFREIAEVFASHHSKQLGGPDDDDSEVTEWSDLEEDGMEDDVLDLDWEEITTVKI